MDASDKEIAVRLAVGKLTEKEQYAYKVFCDSNVAPISPSTAGRMFDAYLQGQSCEDIQKLMPGFTLGQIVHARVVGDWDRQRDEHLERLLQNIRGRVEQTELETVNLIADLIAASKKVIQEKLKRYLLSGKEDDLKGVPIATSIKEWSALMQLLLTSTGQTTKKIEGTIEHKVTCTPTMSAPAAGPKAPTSDEAAEAIEVLLLEGKKKE